MLYYYRYFTGKRTLIVFLLEVLVRLEVRIATPSLHPKL
jgi:hypothetical protein